MANLKNTPKWMFMIGGLVAIVLWVFSAYNSVVTLQVDVENAWAQVEVQYQRRADLIPQLVSTVGGAADFEKSTLTEVTEARTNWMNTSQDPDASIEEQMAASSSFDSALSRLLVTVESYPTLTATEGFQTLQSQLEGTENRISVARKDFNDVASKYNLKIRRVPMNFFASMFGFEEFPFFESSAGSEVAPTIEFDFSS